MKFFKQIKFNKIKPILKKILRIIARRVFLSFLILTFLALTFGAFLFYQYSILTKKAELETKGEMIQFKESTYQKILKEWQVREEKFEEVSAKIHPDPFR